MASNDLIANDSLRRIMPFQTNPKLIDTTFDFTDNVDSVRSQDRPSDITGALTSYIDNVIDELIIGSRLKQVHDIYGKRKELVIVVATHYSIGKYYNPPKLHNGIKIEVVTTTNERMLDTIYIVPSVKGMDYKNISISTFGVHLKAIMPYKKVLTGTDDEQYYAYTNRPRFEHILLNPVGARVKVTGLNLVRSFKISQNTYAV